MLPPLTKTFRYKAPPPRVWGALTNPAQMKVWYFPQLQAFEPIVGYKFRFDDTGADYRKEWVVTRIVPGEVFAHSWAYLGHPGSSEVVFELAEERGGTGLRVTQNGIESFSDDPHFARERFEWGWKALLGINLKGLVDGTQ